MTPAALKRIAASVTGPRKLAQALGVGKDWVYRRISGEVPIARVDELAIRAAMPKRDDHPTLRGYPGSQGSP
jgi:hypothetical protein